MKIHRIPYSTLLFLLQFYMNMEHTLTMKTMKEYGNDVNQINLVFSLTLEFVLSTHVLLNLQT